MRWRIEITRERWTRVQLVNQYSAECPDCLRPLELTAVERGTAAEFTLPQLPAAPRTGRLIVWTVPRVGPMVCTGCLYDLLKTLRT